MTVIIAVAATYVVLIGLIIYLFLAIHSRWHQFSAEIKGTVLDAEELTKHAEERQGTIRQKALKESQLADTEAE